MVGLTRGRTPDVTDPFAPPPGNEPPTYGTPPPPPPYAAPAGYPAPPPYGAPVYGAPLVSPPRNGFGVAALVLGILAIVFFWSVVGGVVLGVLGMVFGFLGRGRAKKGESTNGGMALAGIICGAVGLVISIAWVVLLVAVFSSNSGQKFQDCMNQAGSSSVAQDACKEQFKNDLTG
jgi:hypothetical protein